MQVLRSFIHVLRKLLHVSGKILHRPRHASVEPLKLSSSLLLLLLLVLQSLKLALTLTKHSLLVLLQISLALLPKHALNLLPRLVDLLLKILALMPILRASQCLLQLLSLLRRQSVFARLSRQLLHALSGLLCVGLLQCARKRLRNLVMLKLSAKLPKPLAQRLSITLTAVFHLVLQLL
jgi:hypothetical protein